MNIKEYLLQFYTEQNGENLSQELARGIVEDFAVTDGSDRTNGEKWTISEAKELGEKCGVDFTRVLVPEYYAVLNMLYSDYFEVFKRRGLSDPAIYGDMARAWFEDADGKENKTFKYFFNY